MSLRERQNWNMGNGEWKVVYRRKVWLTPPPTYKQHLNGCNDPSNYRKGDWSKYDVDGPIRGCSIASRQEWVRYPETGAAWQNDKFINEQVRGQLKKYT